MRIGLYGMPTSGKTYIMDQIDFMEVIVGSKLLRQYDPDFDMRDETVREADRRAVANIMLSKPEFIMDGHYAFGDEVAFTEDEGNMYDVYLYLYIDPTILSDRMASSVKNRKYLKYDVAAWQNREINALRKYCHAHNKDFYVLDNPPENCFTDVDIILEFIRAIKNGYSCVKFAKACTDRILKGCVGDTITLLDGDKTLTIEDSSNRVLGYTTHLYDGNFYTGYQAWKQTIEFSDYTVPELTEMPVSINNEVMSHIGKDSYILTSGHEVIWEYISGKLNIPFFHGVQMAAETKYFITKYLQEAGKKVIAYGDGMNDYYMMKQADIGYLVRKQDGRISRSLSNLDLEGVILV